MLRSEELIANAGVRRGDSWATIEEALAASESVTGDDDAEEGELYLSIVARFVAGLGGHVEVVAVFPDETLTLRREPDRARASDPAEPAEIPSQPEST